ncbi:NAD-dependent epimerase/dehydratase family protein [Metabacillus sp. RGM 3146]|uniref:NAD-dependent epimerase/dehydratase family protein n=1 Tax=Metabacillus sp. RGM 3146 TaxID=3401092 RepID=UPI003B9B8AF7
MKSICIFGIHTFLGYALCEKYLQEGIPVYGIYEPPRTEQEKEEFEEKMMLIGRNALLQTALYEKDFPLYDESPTLVYYVPEDKEKADQVNEKKLSRLLDWVKSKELAFILISSLEVFGKKQKKIAKDTIPVPDTDRGKQYLKLEQMVSSAFEEKDSHFVSFRLPLLYGPWQPKHYAFQSVLLNETAAIEEDTREILFIKDAVNAIVKTDLFSFDKGAHLYVSSGKENEWAKAAEILDIESSLSQSIDLPQDLVIPLQETTPVEKGIQLQRVHNEQYKMLYEGK